MFANLLTYIFFCISGKFLKCIFLTALKTEDQMRVCQMTVTAIKFKRSRKAVFNGLIIITHEFVFLLFNIFNLYNKNQGCIVTCNSSLSLKLVVFRYFSRTIFTTECFSCSLKAKYLPVEFSWYISCWRLWNILY